MTPRAPHTSACRTDTAVHIVLMGVAGSGKTSVAHALVERSSRQFAEADDFHPEANVAKMAAGQPLTDADRAPWLAALRDWLTEQADAGHSTVITCSALKRSYRDTLREARGRVVFVHLDGSRELLAQRIGGRTGHYMPASLLGSQLDTLEPLEPDEDGFTLDIAASVDELADEIVARLTARHRQA
jgi:gluconokinase